MIRVGFSRMAGRFAVLSQVIMRMTGRPYSHVWLLLEGVDAVRGVPVVLEAAAEGYRLIPYEAFQKGRIVVKLLPSPKPLGRAVDSAMSRLGADYDALGLIGAGWMVALRRWFRKRARNPFRSPHTMFCSEAVARVLLEAGFQLESGVEPDDLTPGDIEALLLEGIMTPTTGRSAGTTKVP